MNDCSIPFEMDTKPMYYYSKLQQKAFIMTTSSTSIHGCDIDEDEWSLLVQFPKYFGDKYKTCIDEINRKLYLLGEDTFGVFDLEQSKWNVVQSITKAVHKANSHRTMISLIVA